MGAAGTICATHACLRAIGPPGLHEHSRRGARTRCGLGEVVPDWFGCQDVCRSPGEAEVTWLKSHGANLVEAPGWFLTAGLAWGVFASPSCSWGGISMLWRRNRTRSPKRQCTTCPIWCTFPALRTSMPRIFCSFCSGATSGAF